jgi:hypothetical protein
MNVIEIIGLNRLHFQLLDFIIVSSSINLLSRLNKKYMNDMSYL